MSQAAAPPTLASTAGLSRFARALWGLEIAIEPLPHAAPNEPVSARPRFFGSCVWLPTAPPLGSPGNFSDYLLAAVAHASAHVRFGGPRFEVQGLKPTQIAIISLLEDARVEHLAAAQYPGLMRLWTPFHTLPPQGVKTSEALLARLARALHDDRCADDDAWVAKARAHFHEQRARFQEPGWLRRLGGALGNDLGQMRAQFNARGYAVQPSYRDDNIGLWQLERAEVGAALESEGARRSDSKRLDVARDRSGEKSEARRARERMPSGRDFGVHSRPDSKRESGTSYPEWDYVIARERADFCSVFERCTEASDVCRLDDSLARYALVLQRLRRRAQRLEGRRAVHVRRLLDGDRLDLAGAVASLVSLRARTLPEQRVYRRVHFHPEPPALLLLTDLSESLNRHARASSTTLLELARNASALLAASLQSSVPDLGIHGFSSNGRHDVGYYRFKDFREPYDASVRSRLAGMSASLSTRLGPALRHAGQALKERPARRKLLLLITDGEPSDIDIHDTKYLVFDAKRATQQNRARGVSSFCVGLDPNAEASIRQVFGATNWLMVEQLDRLPERLSELFLRLAG